MWRKHISCDLSEFVDFFFISDTIDILLLVYNT